MLTLTLPDNIQTQLISALRASGLREVGGVLMAEHVGLDAFTVRSVTVHRRGSFVSFVRWFEDALAPLRDFFKAANHQYSRFNYIGEWHSHPSFNPAPSPRDDATMREIIQDKGVGANFVVLLIVKLGSAGELLGSVHVYLPSGAKHPADLALCREC